MVRKLLFVLLFCGAPVMAVDPDYFPLQPGNIWIYRASGSRAGSVLVLEITKSADFNGKTYFLLHGLPGGDYWLREDDNGSVLSYDPQQERESLWYAFGSPEGEVYQESIPSCCGRAMVASRTAKYKGPVGEFDTAMEIVYPGVFQIGIGRELFLPYVGMVFRGEATGGPSYATYDLIYARIGGTTVISEREHTFSITLDRSIYSASQNSVMTARLTLRNTQDLPLQVTFPSGQSYDLVLKNDKGEILYQWSRGKLFTQIVRAEEIAGERDYVIVVPLQSLAPGKYVAEGWLTTADPSKAFSASVRFEIVE